jgi:predicted transcriptional regulator of viral defense system
MKKHISYRSSELLNVLNQQEKQFFTISDAVKILSSNSDATVRKLLADMTNRGLILRIKEGLYKVIPYEKNSEEYFPNWHLVAEAMVQPFKYYIGFYSALDIHGLITQPSLIEQVVTEKQMIPKIQMVRDVKFEFITLNKKLFFGFEKTWIDDFNRVYCSDYEKTILDCLYKPSYGGGITEIVKAIYKIREKINQEKIISYLNSIKSQVVIKRLGFILQHLGILEALKKEIKSNVSNSYTYLDPSLPKKGKHTSEWKIIDNSNIESVIKSIET